MAKPASKPESGHQKRGRALRRWREAEARFAREAAKHTNAGGHRPADLEAIIKLTRLRARADKQMNNYFSDCLR